jgi:hypothetical protein
MSLVEVSMQCGREKLHIGFMIYFSVIISIMLHLNIVFFVSVLSAFFYCSSVSAFMLYTAVVSVRIICFILW